MPTLSEITKPRLDALAQEIEGQKPKYGTPDPFEFKTTTFDEIFDYAGKKFGHTTKYPRYIPDYDLEDYYAREQTFGDKTRNSLTTFGRLFGNTYVNHFKSYGRQLSALESGDLSNLWSDEFGERSAEIIRATQNLNPIYETKEQRAAKERGHPFWGALGQYAPWSINATNSWLNLLGQAGFTAGTIGAVLTENAALALTSGGFANAAKAPASVRAIVKSFYQLGKATKYLKDTSRAGKSIKSAKSFSEAFKIAANNKALQGTFTGYRMLVAAQGEASIEANMSALEFRQEQIEKFIAENGYEPPPNVLSEIESQAIKVGNAVHNWNIPVLMASNYAVFGSLFRKTGIPGRGASMSKGFERAVFGKDKTSIKQTLKPFLEKNMSLTGRTLSKSKNYISKAGKFIGRENIGEGVEELMQGVGSRAAQHTFDMQNDDAGNTMLAFLETAMGDELSKSLRTREGWDEFFAGFFTGGGIKAVTSIAKKAYRKSPLGARERRLEKLGEIESGALKWLNPLMGIKKDGANNQTSDLLNQFYTSFGIVSSEDNNNTEEADNFQAQAEAEFYGTVLKYDKLDEVLDLYEDTLKAIENENPDIIKEMLGDGENVIEDRIQQLREGGKKWKKDWEMMRGLVGENPNNPGTVEYNLWEKAFNYAVSIGTIARSDMNKIEKIANRLSEQGLNETIINAIADPSTIDNAIAIQKDLVETQEDTIKQKRDANQPITDRENQQLEKDRGLLNSLQSIKDNKNEEDLAKEVLSEIDVDALPSEMVKDINDLYRIEKEQSQFTHTFNLLQNKDYFDKYINQFIATYSNLENRLRGMVDEPTYEGGEDTLTENDTGLSQQGLEDIINAGRGEGRKTAADLALQELKDKLGEKEERIQETPDGKFLYNGKQYESKDEIYNEILDGLEDAYKSALQENINGETLRKAVKRRWKESTEETFDMEEEALNQEAPTQEETPPHPESRDDAERKSQRHSTSQGSNQAKLHNFTNAFSFIWRKANETSSIIEDLINYLKNTFGVGGKQTQNAAKTQKNIQEFIRKIEADGTSQAVIVTIHGITEDAFVREVGKDRLEALETSNEIYSYHDGGRQYLVFADPGEGDMTSFLAQRLNGLVINERGGFQKVRSVSPDNKLVGLVADFEMSEEFSKEQILTAIQSLTPGQSLGVRIANSDYNRDLIEDYINDDKFDLKTLMYLLEFEFVTDVLVGQNRELITVGKLKSAFAVIQSEIGNQQNKEFRDKLLTYYKTALGKQTINLDDLVRMNRAMVKYVSTETTPNVGISEDGKEMIWTNALEYEQKLPDGWEVDDYYYAVSETDIRSSRNPQKSQRLHKFNRGTDLRKGAVYVRYVNKTTGDSHTSQLYPQEEGAQQDIITLGFEEFNDKNSLQEFVANSDVYLEVGEAPVLSRRVSINLDVSGWRDEEIRAENVDVKEEGIIQDFDAITPRVEERNGADTEVRDAQITWGENNQTILVGAVLNEGAGTINGYVFSAEDGKVSQDETSIPISEIKNVKPIDVKHKKYAGLNKDEIREAQSDVQDIIMGSYQEKTDPKTNKKENLADKANQRAKNNSKNHQTKDLYRKSLLKKIYLALHPDAHKGSPRSVKDLAEAMLKVFNAEVTNVPYNKANISPELLELMLVYFESERAKILQEEENLYEPGLPDNIMLLKTETDRRNWLFFRGPEHVERTGRNGFTVTPIGDYQESYRIDETTGDTVENREVKVTRTRRMGPQGPTVTTQETYYFENGRVKVKDRILDPSQKPTNVNAISENNALQIAYKIFNNENLSYSQYMASKIPKNREKILKAYEKIKNTYEKISQNPVKEVKQLLTIMGMGMGGQGKTAETFFSIMISAYHRSLLSGRPFRSLNELLDGMDGITDNDRAIFRDAISNPFLGLAVWQFITQADSVFKFTDSQKLRDNLLKISQNVEQLSATTEAVREDNKTEEAAKSFRQEIINELNSIIKKVGLAILDDDSLLTTTLENFKDFIGKVLSVLRSANPLEFGKRLARLPVEIALHKASVAIDNRIETMRVSTLSRGRNPIQADHKDGIYLDIAMYREGEGRNLIVRNESDGFFIEMRRPREKATQDVLDLQQRFLDSLQVVVSQEYLMAYKKVNGSFNTLIERINAELMRQQRYVPNSWNVTNYNNLQDMKDMAVDRDGFVISEKNGLVTARTNDTYIKIGGELYRNVFDINKNKSIFVRDGKQLNTLRVNEMLRRAGVKPDMIYERDRLVSKKISNLEGIKKQIDKMRCKL